MKLYYFKKSEFRGYFDLIDKRLLVLLDTLRHLSGIPISVSAHPRAIGRTDGNSWHNYKKHGRVYAIDVMPYTNPELVLSIAMDIGFTGIGYYPDWNPRPGLHLDTRTDRLPENQALWGGINVNGAQRYTTLESALARNDHIGI